MNRLEFYGCMGVLSVGMVALWLAFVPPPAPSKPLPSYYHAVVLLEEILAELQKPPPKAKEMRKEFQHFGLRLGDCEYWAYWTYSFDRSLRLIHAADCSNRGGHVFVLSDGSISTFFGRKK